MNDVIKQIEEIADKEDLLCFIAKLIDDCRNNPEVWENTTVDGYLESMMAWIKDCSASEPNCTDWNKRDCALIAKVLYIGKIYE